MKTLHRLGWCVILCGLLLGLMVVSGCASDRSHCDSGDQAPSSCCGH